MIWNGTRNDEAKEVFGIIIIKTKQNNHYNYDMFLIGLKKELDNGIKMQSTDTWYE